MANVKNAYCCAMREKYLLGIIAINRAVKDPADLVDFVDFDARTEDGRPVIRIKFCPFCGKVITRTDPLRKPPTESELQKDE